MEMLILNDLIVADFFCTILFDFSEITIFNVAVEIMTLVGIVCLASAYAWYLEQPKKPEDPQDRYLPYHRRLWKKWFPEIARTKEQEDMMNELAAKSRKAYELSKQQERIANRDFKLAKKIYEDNAKGNPDTSLWGNWKNRRR